MHLDTLSVRHVTTFLSGNPARLFLATCVLILLSFLLWGGSEKEWVQQLQAFSSRQEKYALLSYLLLTSDILLPIPNSIIMYTNGYLLGCIPGAILSVASLMSSAVIGYYLGKWTNYGIKAATDERAQAFWTQYGSLAILVTRGIPVVSESLCILGGYLKMPLGKYLSMNLIGYIPIALLFAFFGRSGYNQHTFLLSLIGSFGIAGVFWWRGKSMVKPSTAA